MGHGVGVGENPRANPSVHGQSTVLCRPERDPLRGRPCQQPEPKRFLYVSPRSLQDCFLGRLRLLTSELPRRRIALSLTIKRPLLIAGAGEGYSCN